ncbi:EamA family transporter, partial [Streptomyces sp. SID6013]|nr:EamA family transporter [Streptomyces sp. SID6013]
ALGEALGPVQLAGMALAFGATLAGQRAPRGRTVAAAEPFGSASKNGRKDSMDLTGPALRR